MTNKSKMTNLLTPSRHGVGTPLSMKWRGEGILPEAGGRGEVKARGGVRRLSFVIGICFVIWVLTFGFTQYASAVTVTVQMDGVHQIINDQDDNPMPTGEIVQVIIASGETIHVPNKYGGASGGDSVIWAGHGLGNGAFIADFAGSRSLTEESRVYVRAWNGPSLVLSDHYGTSELSDTLEAVVDDNPPMPLECSLESFATSIIFTPEALPIQIISVKINGVRFNSGDIISSRVSLEAVISSEAGEGVHSVLLWVDNIPIYPPLTLISGTSIYGTWSGRFTMPPSSQRKRIFTFHMEDISANGCEVTMEARMFGGAVQVVGGIYNYPNPFKPMSGGTTTIQYTLSKDAGVTIVIYDITGHEAKRMRFNSGVNGGRGGTNQVSWNGRTLGGEFAGNGMYFYKIISRDEVIGSGKLVILD